MATISMERAHALNEAEAISRAEKLVGDLGDKLKAEVRREGRTFTFKGTGFSGTARVGDRKISIDVDLSLALRAFKGKIESRIEQAIREKFA